MKLSLAQAVHLMRSDDGPDDARFSHAWDMVCNHAAASIVAVNAKEHLIWRDPFAPQNFKPVNPGQVSK